MIAEMERKVARLSKYVDQNFDILLAAGTLQGLLDVYGRLASRVHRMKGPASDEQETLMKAIHMALDTLSGELGVKL